MPTIVKPDRRAGDALAIQVVAAGLFGPRRLGGLSRGTRGLIASTDQWTGRALLAPVYASFTEGFAFPDLVEARALLEELGAAPAGGAQRHEEEVRTPQGLHRLREPAPDR